MAAAAPTLIRQEIPRIITPPVTATARRISLPARLQAVKGKKVNKYRIFRVLISFCKFHPDFVFRFAGVPWTEEEHRMFLLGLQKLGKGDWRGIARNYVITRTPTQVASHAQKFFIRQSNISRRKRRSSLFDIVADDFPSQPETQSVKNPLTIPTLEEEECESMDSANSTTADPQIDPTPTPATVSVNLEGGSGSQCLIPMMFPAYVSPIIPVAIPYWPGPSCQDQDSMAKTEAHEVLKPTAVHSKSPINVDDLLGMSKLTLGDGGGAPTSLKVGGLSRQSAFHASNPGARPSSKMDSNHSPIHAV